MHVERRDIVSILEADPELGEHLDPQASALARRHVLARVERVERGRWEPSSRGDSALNGAGLLVLEGLIMREIVLVGRETAELLGPGDVLKPFDTQEDFEALPVRAEWQVCEPAAFAVLDHRFVSVAGRWPELLDSILARSNQRTRRLAVQLAGERVQPRGVASGQHERKAPPRGLARDQPAGVAGGAVDRDRAGARHRQPPR